MKNRAYYSPVFAVLMIFVLWFVLYSANPDLFSAEPQIGMQNISTATPQAATESTSGNSVKYLMLEPSVATGFAAGEIDFLQPQAESKFLFTALFLLTLLSAIYRIGKIWYKNNLTVDEENRESIKKKD